MKTISRKNSRFSTNVLQVFIQSPYNFRLGSFVDAAVRQYSLQHQKNVLEVR